VKGFNYSHIAMNNHLPIEDLRIIRIRDVIALTGLSRSAIYAAVKAGTFPRQVKLSARSSGWFRAEVVLWLKERPRSQETPIAAV
jgi:prophage regulatory protein